MRSPLTPKHVVSSVFPIRPSRKDLCSRKITFGTPDDSSHELPQKVIILIPVHFHRYNLNQLLYWTDGILGLIKEKNKTKGKHIFIAKDAYDFFHNMLLERSAADGKKNITRCQLFAAWCYVFIVSRMLELKCTIEGEAIINEDLSLRFARPTTVDYWVHPTLYVSNDKLKSSYSHLLSTSSITVEVTKKKK